MPKLIKSKLKHEAIRADFEKLTAKKHMRSGKAMELLADKYFLQQGTVEDIVYKTGKYAPEKDKTIKNQLTIFDALKQ